MEKWRNEVNKNSQGGTEQMMTRLYNTLGDDFLEDFQIIPSRVRELDESKIRVLWCHDLPDDPESKHLRHGGHQKFHKLVFCSNWQQQKYIETFNIPWSKTVVLKNAITPIDINLSEKFKQAPSQVNVVYHTTPHRGLELLVPAFEKLTEKYDNIHLHVFSSFKIYGWEQRDEVYKPLYDKIQGHEKMTYHGFTPNSELREHLKEMHIFGYPSIWPETSCISLIEAMSAGLLCLHPNFGALYETASNWTFMYNFLDDKSQHAGTFCQLLDQLIGMTLHNDEYLQNKLFNQKNYADLYYNWETRAEEWRNLLNSLRSLPRDLVKDEEFVYKIDG